MRTTLDLDDHLVREAKRRALDQGSTLTSFIEEALRERLRSDPARTGSYRFRPLLKKGSAASDVDFDDRDALYELMEGRG